MARKNEVPLQNIHTGLIRVLEKLDQRKRMALLTVITDEGDDEYLLKLLAEGTLLSTEEPRAQKFKKAFGSNPMHLRSLQDPAFEAYTAPVPTQEAAPTSRRAEVDHSQLLETALDVRLELAGVRDDQRAQLLAALREMGVFMGLEKVVTGRGDIKVTRAFHEAKGAGDNAKINLAILRSTYEDHKAGMLPDLLANEQVTLGRKRAARKAAEAEAAAEA